MSGFRILSLGRNVSNETMNTFSNHLRPVASSLRVNGSSCESGSPRPGAEAAPPLDLEQLRRRCMGRLDLVDRLLASFESRFPVELLEIEQSLAAEDMPRLLQLVHQLKGASANISAPGLHRIIQSMEAAARANQLTTVADQLSQLQSEWERFTEFKGSVALL